MGLLKKSFSVKEFLTPDSIGKEGVSRPILSSITSSLSKF
jgi:hypothetical protein